MASTRNSAIDYDEDEANADIKTGVEAFATPQGLMEFTIGIFNGTSMIVDENDMLICSDSIVIDIIGGAKDLYNKTADG